MDLPVCSCHVTYAFQSESTLRFRACFEQEVPWHPGNYWVWIRSERRTWHDKNIESNASYRKYSEHSSIIWPVWPNGWAFVYELSGSGFKYSCSHLKSFLLFTSLTSILFLKFFIVFPYIALFINLYNAFPSLSPFFLFNKKKYFSLTKRVIH